MVADTRWSSIQPAQGPPVMCKASIPTRDIKADRQKQSKCSKRNAEWLPSVSENCATTIKNSNITEVCSIFKRSLMSLILSY